MIRILRIMEYIYPDEEIMIKDMARWEIQGTKVINARSRQPYMIIKSTTISPEFQGEDRLDIQEDEENA